MFKGGSAADLMPWGAVIGLSILLTAAGVLVMVVGRRAIAGRLSRNYLIGIRTTATLSSDASWSAGHRASGKRLTIAGLGPLVAGPLLLMRPSNGVGATLILASTVWLVGWVMAAGSQAQRAVDTIDD